MYTLSEKGQKGRQLPIFTLLKVKLPLITQSIKIKSNGQHIINFFSSKYCLCVGPSVCVCMSLRPCVSSLHKMFTKNAYVDFKFFPKCIFQIHFFFFFLCSMGHTLIGLTILRNYFRGYIISICLL